MPIDMTRIELQNKEFDALTALAENWAVLRQVAVVDDDYPLYRNRYERALTTFIDALRANGRPVVMPMTFGQFSEANRARCESRQGFNHPLKGWSTSDWFLAMIGEFGEAANIAKKLNRVRDGIPGNGPITQNELQAKLRRELADAFIYLDLTAQSLGFNIAEAAVEVFNAKSAEIGYPKKL